MDNKTISSKIENLSKQVTKSDAPLWQGPTSTGPNGGITFSLLSRFLVCRERFRIYAIEGIKPTDAFNHRIEYGSMWHVCEEALAKLTPIDYSTAIKSPFVFMALQEYCQELCKRYPTQQEAIDHWYNVCKVQFPIYVKFWKDHPDTVNRTPLLQEYSFSVPYRLPSGRVVILKGKWDSVDLICSNQAPVYRIYLQENKTKGDINEVQLKRQLGSGFDFQTMIYLVALVEFAHNSSLRDKAREVGGLRDNSAVSIAGIRYNVIRRPLSGGKGTIIQHKPSKSNPMGETKEEFYKRLRGVINDDRPNFFMRWRIEVTNQDIVRFKMECLDPILEQLCDWYEEVGRFCNTRASITELVRSKLHFRYPFGIYNPLTEGGDTYLDQYLLNGSTVGLARADNLFPELG